MIAVPWHVLATLRNPPYFDFTLHSAPGEYHGFLWFYFINEQVLRFLNLRYPRDYDTVPRAVFLAAASGLAVSLERLLPGGGQTQLQARGPRRQTRLLALCWTGFVLVFFTFSTTQEYYSMPAIRRWRCFWDRQWRWAATGFAGNSRARGDFGVRGRRLRLPCCFWCEACPRQAIFRMRSVRCREPTRFLWGTWAI